MPLTVEELQIKVGSDIAPAERGIKQLADESQQQAARVAGAFNNISYQRLGQSNQALSQQFQRLGNVNLAGTNQQLSGLNQHLGQTLTAATGAAGGVTSLGVSVAVLGANLAAAAIQKGIQLFISIGQGAVGAYAETERLSLSLQSLVAKELRNVDPNLKMADAFSQASGKAAELVKWTQMLAIKSPFNQQDVAQAFKMAQAYGFVSDSTDKAVITAKRLTQATIDYAAASGQTGEVMARISLALGQIQAKGKLAGGEMLQLTEAGLPVRDILAKAFHVTTAELVAMQERGLIPADRAIKAIVESLEHDFAGAAERQSGTISGLIESLQDLQKLGGTALFGGMIRAVQPELQKLVDLLTEPQNLQRITDFGNAIGQHLADAIKLAEDVIGPLLDSGDKLQQMAIDLTPYLNGAGAAMAGYALVITLQAIPANLALATQILTTVVPALAAQAIAAAAAVAPYLLLAGAVAAMTAAWQDYQAKVHAGAEQMLAGKKFWQDSAQALKDYNAASDATKERLKGEAQLLQEQRAEYQKNIESLQNRLNKGEIEQQQFDSEMKLLRANGAQLEINSQIVMGHVRALESQAASERTIETLEDDRLARSKAMVQALDALKPKVSEYNQGLLTAAANSELAKVRTEDLGKANVQLKSDLELAAKGMLASGDQALALSQKYAIATDAANQLIDAQKAADASKYSADMGAFYASGGKAYTADQYQHQQELHQAELAKAAELAKIRRDTAFNEAKDAVKLQMLKADRDKLDKGSVEWARKNAEYEALRFSIGQRALKNDKERLDTEQKIAEAKRQQLRSMLDMQIAGLDDAKQKRAEARQLLHAKQVLGSGDFSADQKAEAADLIQRIPLLQQQRQLNLGDMQQQMADRSYELRRAGVGGPLSAIGAPALPPMDESMRAGLLKQRRGLDQAGSLADLQADVAGRSGGATVYVYIDGKEIPNHSVTVLRNGLRSARAAGVAGGH